MHCTLWYVIKVNIFLVLRQEQNNVVHSVTQLPFLLLHWRWMRKQVNRCGFKWGLLLYIRQHAGLFRSRTNAMSETCSPRGRIYLLCWYNLLPEINQLIPCYHSNPTLSSFLAACLYSCLPGLMRETKEGPTKQVAAPNVHSAFKMYSCGVIG
jgi:hypothetical protein